MGDHRVLVPLGQQDVETQAIFRCQWLGGTRRYLARQRAANAVGLLGDILLQLYLAQPEDEHQDQDQGRDHHQRHRAGQRR
ncbi:hypothetical protein B7O88_01495 [Halopseudomonas aestusnigri]|nr:hypothetical protein B7O88_01495 [Halopseudomonas aestusnigri]